MREDIEFADEGIPLSVGVDYNDLGRVEGYVLSFEGWSIEVSKTLDGHIAFDDGLEVIMIPLPIIEAMMRLDLAALVTPKAKERE